MLKSFIKSLLTTLYNVEVTGLENFEKAGKRVLIIANHSSFLDALLIAAFLPDKLMFAVNTFISRRWWMKPFLALVDAYPLDPTNPMATKALIEEIKKDKKCVIFPEGRITVTGSLMKVYEGPGMIADKSSAKLLPIRIDGAQYTPFSRLRGKVRIRLFPRITLAILPPLEFAVASEIKGKKRRAATGKKLYDVMTEMMFEAAEYRKTLFQALLDAKATHGNFKPVVSDIARKPANYLKLVSGSFALGQEIAKATKEGENVGLLLPNSVSTITAFFALQAYGRVVAMLNFSVGSKNIISACKTAEIKTVYTSKRFIELGKLADVVTGLKQEGVNVIYLEEVVRKINFIEKIKAFGQAVFPQFHYNETGDHNPEKAAVILFTSGSEGTPKGVVLSHANLQANRFQLASRVDFNPSDIVFNALPVFHSFGLTGGTLLPLLSGLKVFLYPSPLHYRIVPELVYDENATIMFGTDTFLSGYARFAHPYDFYSIRYVFAGAEKLKEETRKVWAEKFGVRIFEGYGATETSPALATNTPMQNRPGTVGRMLPGIMYQVETVPGIERGGKLVVAGPNIMKGYLLSSSPGTLIQPENGWYDTGDIIEFDEEGYISIKGRAKRFAKIGGEMVSLTAVERELENLWPGQHHAVVSLPDPKKGEQLVLITDKSGADRSEITSHMKKSGVSELSIPRKIIEVKQVPLLGTGKTDYTKVKELAEQAA